MGLLRAGRHAGNAGIPVPRIVAVSGLRAVNGNRACGPVAGRMWNILDITPGKVYNLIIVIYDNRTTACSQMQSFGSWLAESYGLYVQ